MACVTEACGWWRQKSYTPDVPRADERMIDVSLAGLAIPVSFNTSIIRTCHHKLLYGVSNRKISRTILLRMSLRGLERFYCHDWYVEDFSLGVFITWYLFRFCYSNTCKCDRFNIISKPDMTLGLRGFVGFWSLQALTHLHEKNVIYRVWEPGMFICFRGLTVITFL